MKNSLKLLAVIFIIAGCGPDKNPDQIADTIYTNGKIYTVNEDHPWVEAVAIKDGKFLKVGTTSEMELTKGEDTKVIDLGGKFVMPGVVDAHVHPYDVYLQDYMGNLKFSNLLDAEGIAQAIREYAAANPEKKWIKGGVYGAGAFPGAKMTKEWLDEVVPDKPAYMWDEFGHNATANSKALELAGITSETPDPPLGVVDKDPVSGEPTGYLSETGMGLVGRLLDRATPETYQKAMERSLKEIQAWGVTSFIDMSVNKEVIDAYFNLDKSGELPFRVNTALAMNEYSAEIITAEEARTILPEMVKRSSDKINTNNFKFWGDGTPISYTSLLVDKYADKNTYGEVTMNEDMRADAIQYLGQGISGHIHTITDGTIRYVLDLVEEARAQYPGKVKRFHMGHCMLIHPDDYKRFIELDVVAEIGPAMWYPSPVKPIIEGKLGAERAKNWFNIRAMLDAGIKVAWGSDWPAGTPDANPFRGLEALITRAHPWGESEGSWGTPISMEEGLQILTMGGAYAMQKEDEIGSIEVGKYADMIVLDRNLFEINPADISDIVVETSIFNGEVRYELSEK